MTVPNHWLVKIGAQIYPAPNLETVRQWHMAGRIPNDAFLFDPVTTQWKPAGEVLSAEHEALPTAVAFDVTEAAFNPSPEETTEPPEERQRHAWFVQIGDERHSVESLEVLKRWYREGRIPKTAIVFFPSLNEWRPAPQIFEFESESLTPVVRRPTPLLVKLLPVLFVGACSGFVGLVMVLNPRDPSTVSTALNSRAAGRPAVTDGVNEYVRTHLSEYEVENLRVIEPNPPAVNVWVARARLTSKGDLTQHQLLLFVRDNGEVLRKVIEPSRW